MTRRKPAHQSHRARHLSPREVELKKHQDELLDEALRETFPASDPIAVDPVETVTAARRRRRKHGSQ